MVAQNTSQLQPSLRPALLAENSEGSLGMSSLIDFDGESQGNRDANAGTTSPPSSGTASTQNQQPSVHQVSLPTTASLLPCT